MSMKDRSLIFDSQFDYIESADRYYLKNETPRYKINVIGCGVNGQEHIRVSMLEGRAIIHGVYDPNKSSIDAAKSEFAKYVERTVCEDGDRPELKVYESLEAACNDKEVDALIICTPNYTHLEVLKTSIKSGKHILLEKPIATTVSDAQQVVEFARSYDAVFQIGLQYRHKAIYVEALHEVFERKSIGEVKKINLLEHRIPFLDKVNQWNKFSKYSGNTLIEKCCHYFDLLNLIADSKPKQVYATGGMAVNFKDFEHKGEASDILDHANVNIVYENDVCANFDLCMFAPMINEELTVLGDHGRLYAEEKTDFLARGNHGSLVEIDTSEHTPSRKITPAYPKTIEESGHHGATYYAHGCFIDQIEGKSRTSATVEEAFWSLLVAAAAQESIEKNCIVQMQEFLQKHKLAALV